MNECTHIIAVSTNTIHVCILATISRYNLVKYLRALLLDWLIFINKFQYNVTGHYPGSLHESTQFVTIYNSTVIDRFLVYVIVHIVC